MVKFFKIILVNFLLIIFAIIFDIYNINFNNYFSDDTLFQIHNGIVTITFGIIILIFGFFRDFDKIEKQMYLKINNIVFVILLIFENYFLINLLNSNIIPLSIIGMLIIMTTYILIDLLQLTSNTNYYINRTKKIVLQTIEKSVNKSKNVVKKNKDVDLIVYIVECIRNDLDEISYVLDTKINSNNIIDKNIARMISRQISLPKNYKGIDSNEYSKLVYYHYIKVLHSNIMEMMLKAEYDNPSKIIYIIELMYESMKTIIENGYYYISPNSMCVFQLYNELPQNIENEVKNITHRYGYELLEKFAISIQGKRIEKEKIENYLMYNYMILMDDQEFEKRVNEILTITKMPKQVFNISLKTIKKWKEQAEN